MSVTSGTGPSALFDEARSLRGPRAISWGLLAAALLLSMIGVAVIHSASAELAVDYLPRQLVWIGLGLAALGFGAVLDYHYLLRLATPLYVLGLVAVALVLVFGHEAGGARSWIGIAGLGGQPSDLAKLGTAVFLARYFGGVRQEYLGIRHLATGLLVVGAPMALIVVQPDLGGAVMFAPLLATMGLLSGVRLRLIAAAAAIAVVVGLGVWHFGMRDYQQDRILSFAFPERDPLGAGYQIRQSKIAVGSGGLLGKGYLQGTQSQLRFLPARHTDFVFAVLAEEWGFLGVVVVLLLYLLFLGNGVRIAAGARDRPGVLLASGLLAALCAHVLYNTAMVIGLVPVTGIPIPFLSYGGSFALFSFFTAGILLGIDARRYVNRP